MNNEVLINTTAIENLYNTEHKSMVVEEIPKDEIRRLEKLFQQKVSDVFCTDECKEAMNFLKRFSSNLIRNMAESETYYFVEDSCNISVLVDNDNCIKFFKNYIKYVTENSSDLMEITLQRKYTNFTKFVMAMWNLSDKFDSLCVRMVSFDVHTLLIRLLGKMNISSKEHLKPPMITLLIMSTIGILHNIVNKLQYTRSKYRSENFVHILMPLAALETSKDTLGLKTAALMVLGFLVNENENSVLNARDDHIVYILDILNQSLNSSKLYSTYYGYHCLEVLSGLKHIAAPDSNKRSLISNGVLSMISIVLNVEIKHRHKEIVAALELLWSLSFVRECLLALDFDGCDLKGKVENLAQSSNQNITLAARGILWNLNNVHRSMSLNSLIRNDWKTPNTNGHVMVSYQHSTQEIMVKVKDSLIKNGYKVWMDVDYMRGSFVDAMAEGIQHASVLLLGMCQAFKNSPHCRQEVKYAYTLGIPLVPIMLEPGFVPDGWLGLMCATLIYTEFIDNSKFDANMLQLQTQLGEFGRPTDTLNVEAPLTEISSSLTNSQHSLSPYSSEDDQSTANFSALEMITSSHSIALNCARRTSQNLLSETSTENSSKFGKFVFQNQELPMNPPTHFDNRTSIDVNSISDFKFHVMSWTTEECTQWFEGILTDLSKCSQLKIQNIDGSLLLELADMRKSAPEAFFKAVKEDLLLSFVDILRLSRALRQLD